MYVHAEDFEYDEYGEYGEHGKHEDIDNHGEYINHGECGEYDTGKHSVCIQHIQWYDRAEISEHGVTNTDDRHASRSWHHMRRRSRGA